MNTTVAASQQNRAQGGAASNLGPDLTASLQAIETAIEEARRELKIPGMALAIVKDDHVIFMKGFGQRDVEHHLAVTPETVFALGSTTKAFTALAAVIGVDKRKLSLDDSPRKYLPYLSFRDPILNRRATIRDLLSHRTGLLGSDLIASSDALSRKELIMVAGLAKPTAKLRTTFQYNNVTFSAAGEAVAKAQRTSWENLIARDIFKPLGMSASSVTVEEMQKSANFSRGYALAKGSEPNELVDFRSVSNVAPSAAINSSAKDMAQWLRLMLGGGRIGERRLVSEENFRQLFAKQIDIDEGSGYGLGWILSKLRGHTLIWHNGGIEGFYSLVELLPDEHVGYLMLANVDDESQTLEDRVRKIVWSNLLKPAPQNKAGEGNGAHEDAETNVAGANSSPANPGNSDDQRDLVGTYEDESDGASAQIKAQGEQLLLLLPGQPPYQMKLRQRGEFGVEGLPSAYTVQVERDSAGAVTAILLREPEGTSKFVRVADFKSPISVEHLMSQVIAAAGGEKNLRSHTSMRAKVLMGFENLGVTGRGTISSRAPNSLSSNISLTALGKNIADLHEFFDGQRGGEETSLSPPEMMSEAGAENFKTVHDFYKQLLDWKSLFKTVKIEKMAQMGRSKVYVMVKTPANAPPITDYISASTFRLLKRTWSEVDESGHPPATVEETYGAYRSVEGVVIPFRIVQQTESQGRVTTSLQSVAFNVKIPDAEFKPKMKL